MNIKILTLRGKERCPIRLDECYEQDKQRWVACSEESDRWDHIVELKLAFSGSGDYRNFLAESEDGKHFLFRMKVCKNE